MYQNITLADFVSRVCNPSYNTTPNELKESIFRMLLKIQEIELKRNDDVSISAKNPDQNFEIVEKLQIKMMEMEERRKLWDLEMADHMTEKNKFDQILKIKLNELSNQLVEVKNFNHKIDNIEEKILNCNDRMDVDRKDVKNTLLQQEQKILKIREEIEEKTNSLRVDVNSTIERVEKGEKDQEGFKLSLGSKIEEILKNNKSHQSDPHGKVHFQISCNELIAQKRQVQRNSLSDEEYDHNKDKEEDTKNNLSDDKRYVNENDEEKCRNITLIASNLERLEELQNYIKDNEEVMERFQNKLIKIFDNLEVLQSKFADILEGKGSFGSNQLASQSQSQNMKNFQLNPQQTNSYFGNSSVASNNVPTDPSFKPPVTESNTLAPRNNAENSYFGNMMQNQDQPMVQSIVQPIVQPEREPFPAYLLANTPYDYKFNVKNDVITYLEATETTSSVIFGKYLMKARKTFSVSIVHTSNKYICIGVADVNLYYMPDIWGQENFAMMRGYEGEVYSGPNEIIKKTNEKFKVGDEVAVAFDPKDGKVTWYLNNKLVAKFKSKKFSDSSISWVPLIRFFNSGDSVKWNYHENRSL